MIDRRFRLVMESRWQRQVLRVALVVVILCAVGFGYWLGGRVASLDRVYVAALERQGAAHERSIARLNQELVDARLGQTVDQQAAQSLRNLVSDLRDEVAGLEEEVIFYKSLMAPSSLVKGLQISDFEVLSGEDGNQFAFRLLLTQTEVRRDWVQGGVELAVRGWMRGESGPDETVLSFADLGAHDTYPFRFKFRYFQNLTGQISLPEGFTPALVLVKVVPKGKAAQAVERSFQWNVHAG